MKFGKHLKQQIEDTLPDWRDNFLSYKLLKKLIRIISGNADANIEFVSFLNFEIEKFNSFFIEQEEDFVIRHRELKERIERDWKNWGPNESGSNDPKVELGKIREDIVNLRGEMVLLLNYSKVNYTGLGKILKKYEKRRGELVRVSFMEKILRQPFYKTEAVSKMIKDCENSIDAIFPPKQQEEEQVQYQNNNHNPISPGILKNTVSALLSMQQIRRGSSTYSHFSLPPLNFPDSYLIINNSPIPIL